MKKKSLHCPFPNSPSHTTKITQARGVLVLHVANPRINPLSVWIGAGSSRSTEALAAQLDGKVVVLSARLRPPLDTAGDGCLEGDSMAPKGIVLQAVEDFPVTQEPSASVPGGWDVAGLPLLVGADADTAIVQVTRTCEREFVCDRCAPLVVM